MRGRWRPGNGRGLLPGHGSSMNQHNGISGAPCILDHDGGHMARTTKTDVSRQDQAVPDVIEVRPEQDQALLVLLRGGGVQDAADAAGVARQTVSTWLHTDDRFIAELNRRRSLIWSAYADQLRSLAVDALGVLADQLRGDDPAVARQVALCILKASAGVDLAAVGPVDPERVRLTWSKDKVSMSEWIIAGY